MNPAQYKLAMQQRALDRQAQKDRLQHLDDETRLSFSSDTLVVKTPTTAGAATERALSATYPPRRPSLLKRGNSLLSRFLNVEREESENSAATSIASSVGLEGFEVGNVEKGRLQLGQLGQAAGREDLSPLAPPGALPTDWSNPPSTHLTGFDKQAGMYSTGVDNEREDALGFPRLCGGGVRAVSWGKKPGETSITQSVRLFIGHRDPDASHEENCSLVLRQILERVATEELDVTTLKMRHVIKLEAFLRSVVLSVPTRTWQQSVRGAFALTAPTGNGGSGNRPPGQVQQISEDELTFRMSLFVAIMKAERERKDGSDVAIDVFRVESVVRGYGANAVEILPLQHPARTLLPPLLFCMACEILGVRLLAPEVRDVCRQIVADYEARAKLWMSPAQNADRFLRPLVTEFASWIRHNKEVLYQGSATEGLLRSIDEDLRSGLKNQVYRSPQHFLAVVKSLAPELTDMPLPSYDPSGGDDDHPFDVSQTLKDVGRERFEVNGTPTEPSECWHEIRDLLLKETTGHVPRSTSPGAVDADSGGRRTAEVITSKGSGSASRGAAVSSPSVASESERDASESDPSPEASASCGDAAAGDIRSGGRPWGTGTSWKSRVEAECLVPKSGLEKYVDQCAWRVLHAASRTASGGDGFFVVQDLFGGDGVLVKMATGATERIRIRTKGMSARVTTVDKYDIYHTSDVDISSAESSPRPLMTITTTMKEVIRFAPYTSSPSARKSVLFADGPGSASPEEAANMQPSHAKSARFITISAGLPDYPEDHLDASAGVLMATTSAPLSMEQERTQRAQQHKESLPDATSVSDLARLAINVDGSTVCEDGLDGVSFSSDGLALHRRAGLRRRPSAFNSPPPAALSFERKQLNDSDSDSGAIETLDKANVRGVRDDSASSSGGIGEEAAVEVDGSGLR